LGFLQLPPPFSSMNSTLFTCFKFSDAMMKTFHESYSRDETVIGGSGRSFGIVMAAAFALMSLLNWWHDGHSWRWTGGIAVLFLATALLYPEALKPLNRLWLKFGLCCTRW
jgi:hypothetical protein